MPTRTLAALVAASVLAGPARAGTPAEEAKEAAYQAYGVSDYDSAITHYKAAYRLTSDPRLFYNLGLSHRKRFELRTTRADAVEARDYFRRFLQLVDPTDPAHAAERDRLEQTQALARSYAAEMDAEIAKLDARRPPPRRFDKLLLAGAGALAVAGGVTGVLALRAQGDAEDANAIDDFDAAISAARSADRYALATDLLLGAAIVSGGLGLYLALSRSDDRRDRTVFSVSPGGVALTVRY